jgi:phospho-N-acetylmuramoyl-pentapeptide-transferase
LLYWLLYEKLYPFFHPFRIFRYLTFRTAFASLTALLIALFIGPWVIRSCASSRSASSSAKTGRSRT